MLQRSTIELIEQETYKLNRKRKQIQMRKALTFCTEKRKETIKEIRDNNTTGDNLPGDVLKL
jgi:hypothetical protein